MVLRERLCEMIVMIQKRREGTIRDQLHFMFDGHSYSSACHGDCLRCPRTPMRIDPVHCITFELYPETPTLYPFSLS